ncbi:CBS domain-containing protein [candidate division KSB1 bacterium]|nr:CBS domain-containing protein [candidate division KSB1 bacterium]
MMDVTVEEIMVKDVVCVHTSVSLQELVEIFFSKSVSGVPVIDDDSKLVGIISKTDLVTHGLEKELNTIIGTKMADSSLSDLPDFDNLLGPEPSQSTVGEIMTSPVITAEPRTKVSKIARIMLENKIHRVVITKKDRVVGIVSSMDLLRLLK